ncbi:MAG TPA: histidinol dehydrogenase [Steroidobacteraceae bacterium]|jgi:histidinol dehydrogenase
MQILDWQRLDEAGRLAALERPAAALQPQVLQQSRAIVEAVRAEGESAVRRFARQFDAAEPAQLQVSAEEFSAARAALTAEQIEAIERAIANVERFHRAGQPLAQSLEVQPGVHCERLLRPLAAVGLYVPAGGAPLPSTVIMLAVPARIAGCPLRVLCTPPRRDGSADAAVLVAAQLCGIELVFKLGGAQAIAALAYGRAGIPKVFKIFGPGNAWVTAAKQLVAADPAGAALDLPAGPSEVLVIADDSARAEFVAADLLAQAEHDPLAQAILLTPSAVLAARVAECVSQQLRERCRQAILRQSIAAARIVLVADLQQALAVSDRYAPEHLMLCTRDPRALLDQVQHAGAVFLGHWSPEPIGDYCSGTNHVLPTYGYARSYSGLSVQDFVRHMSVQELSRDGLLALGPTASTLARLEGLDAHAAAVELRLEALRRERAA